MVGSISTQPGGSVPAGAPISHGPGLHRNNHQFFPRQISNIHVKRIVPAFLLVLGIGASIAWWPTETRWGVNYVYFTQEVPLFEKVIDFASREFQTGRLVDRILNSEQSDTGRLLTLFSWTLENVRNTPEGMPIVDDHVLNIIIRGYGAPDQQAEAFALLADYAGFPAKTGLFADGDNEYLITLVEISEEWYPFDVPNGILFVDERGQLLSLTSLKEGASVPIPQLRVEVPATGYNHGEGFWETIAEAELATDRMDSQRLWRRPFYEAKGWLHGMRE